MAWARWPAATAALVIPAQATIQRPPERAPSGQVLYVDDNGVPGGGNGANWTRAFRRLQMPSTPRECLAAA